MATAMTDTVLNYSGMLYAKSNNDTRLVDAILTRGRRSGEGIVRTGVRKVNSIEYVLASPYAISAGSQPAISENASLTAPEATNITRTQQKNNIQLFQRSVNVSYLKSSATGTLAGLNIAGARNNVPNEFDFQATSNLILMKKDLNFTYINGVKHESSSNTDPWKTGGLLTGLTSNAVSIPHGQKISAKAIHQAIVSAFNNGFQFIDGSTTIWCNPSNLEDIDAAYQETTGFGQPLTRSEGGVAITSILTHFGLLNVDYDVNIPAGTFLILNVSDLAIAELDAVVDNVNKGCWFYESLPQAGASAKGQLYGQAGVDYGAEWQHIKFTTAAE